MKVPSWMKSSDWIKPIVRGAIFWSLHALTWLILLWSVGLGCLVYGVFLIAGAGPAFLVAGFCLLLAGGQIKKGMTSG